MAVIAYMLTWTTYGTWLQGDGRRWAKNGEIYSANPALESANRRQMTAEPAALSKEQRVIASRAIIDEAAKLKQQIFALAACDNHIHLVVRKTPLPIGQVVSHYKHAARLALQKQGFEGKLWTKDFDKRYCVNDKELAAKIAYVAGHKNTDAEIIVS